MSSGYRMRDTRGPCSQAEASAGVSRTRALVAICVALALAVVAAAPAGATFPGRNGRFAYVTESDAFGSNLFTNVSNGTDERSLGSGGFTPSQPQWSPQGRRLLFTEPPNGVYTVTANGTHQAKVFASSSIPYGVPGTQSITGASWGPHARRIAIGASWEYVDPTFDDPEFTLPGYAIFSLTADGHHLRRLHGGEGPAWSPRGRLIAFITRNSDCECTRIALIRPNGHRFRVVMEADDPSSLQGLDFSPNGRKLLFLYNRGPYSPLHVR